MKVLLHTLEGRDLVRKGEAWSLTNDGFKAELFDYPNPELANELRELLRAHGSTFDTGLLDALQTYEICDRCGQMLRPMKAFFDGEQFVCPQCKAGATSLGFPAGWERNGAGQGHN